VQDFKDLREFTSKPAEFFFIPLNNEVEVGRITVEDSVNVEGM